MPETTVRSIRRVVDRISRGERRNVRALLRRLEDIRRALTLRLVEGGTEFDQAFKREMIRETEAAMVQLQAELRRSLGEQFAGAARAGTEETLRQVGVALADDPLALPSLVGIDTDILDFVSEETDNLVKGLTSSAKQEITRIVNSGAVGTATPQDVARQLGTVLSRAGRPEGVFGRLATQVERIHRTETSTLFTLSHRATSAKAVQQVGREARKKWITVIDGRTRPAHLDMNGATIPFDEHFNVGAGKRGARLSWEEAGRRGAFQGEKADVPLDPGLSAGQRINCRCTFALAFGKARKMSPAELLGVGDGPAPAPAGLVAR